MRNFIFSTIGAFAILATFSLTSCTEDLCKSVVCANHGTCTEEGTCLCPVGYEGERCETITRFKYKGAWAVTESGSSSGPIQYSVSIEDGAEIDDIEIRNFYNLFNVNVKAKVKGDTIYIPIQDVQHGEDTKTIEGKGYIAPQEYYGLHGTLIFRYKVTSSDGSFNNFGMDGADNPSIWEK